MKCKVCQRDPERRNSDIAECSVVDCPHRRRAWSDGPEHSWRPPEPEQRTPIEDLFDNPNELKR